MNILKLQEQIDNTKYWDSYALDFRASFFGDECKLYIEIENGKSDQYCWEIVFYRCFKVDYETDAGWTCWESDTGTRDFNMKDIPHPGYDEWGYDIYAVIIDVSKRKMI